MTNTQFLQSLESSLDLSAALDSSSLIAVHGAHRFSLTNGSSQAATQWARRRPAGDSHTNRDSHTLSATSAGSKPRDVPPGIGSPK